MGKRDPEYERYYQERLAEAQVFQDHVIDVMYDHGLPLVVYSSRQRQFDVGESRGGVEIKYDRLFAETGNLWIEVAEKTDPSLSVWTPSGIERKDGAWLWLIGNYDLLFCFPVKYLRFLRPRYTLRINTTGTSQGFLLPAGDAHKYAANVFYPHRYDDIPF